MKKSPKATKETPMTLFKRFSMRSLTKFLIFLAVKILRISKLKKVSRMVPRNKNSILLSEMWNAISAMARTMQKLWRVEYFSRRNRRKKIFSL